MKKVERVCSSLKGINLSARPRIIGLWLKLGVIVSCGVGIYLYTKLNQSGFMYFDNVLLYFTTQSNILIAAVCLVFLIIDLMTRGNRVISNWLYVLKYASTTSIMLTFVVFSIILAPMMEKSFLTSGPNIFLHNLAPLLAFTDFILCDYEYSSSKKHVLYGIIMPGLYIATLLILSFNGIEFGEKNVPYFFLDYETLGWLSIGENGIGVVYWLIMISALLLLIGAGILKVKDLRRKRSKTDMVTQ
jgi:hypothetical protein